MPTEDSKIKPDRKAIMAMARSKAYRRLTPKQETFCQRIVEGMKPSEAYRNAGYTVNNMVATDISREGSEIMNNPKIVARIAELRERAMIRHDVTVDSLTEELEEARELSMRNGRGSAAVSAVMGKAKLHGLLIDKIESKNVNMNVQFEVTDADREMLKRLRDKAAAITHSEN